MTNTCKIIGISGGSGAGRTTLANGLFEHCAGEAISLSSLFPSPIKTEPQLAFAMIAHFSLTDESKIVLDETMRIRVGES